jgi:hypothetical protein
MRSQTNVRKEGVSGTSLIGDFGWKSVSLLPSGSHQFM